MENIKDMIYKILDDYKFENIIERNKDVITAIEYDKKKVREDIGYAYKEKK